MKPVQASASACWNDHFSWQRLFNARALRWKLHEIATSTISLPIIYDSKIRSTQNDCVVWILWQYSPKHPICICNSPCNSPAWSIGPRSARSQPNRNHTAAACSDDSYSQVAMDLHVDWLLCQAFSARWATVRYSKNTGVLRCLSYCLSTIASKWIYIYIYIYHIYI